MDHPTFLPYFRQVYEDANRDRRISKYSAGLLSCYEPQIRGMDLKNPEKKHLKAVMERYKQMLNSVLQDYTINSNEWAHVLSTPKLWCAFMTQVYSAFIEGRIADLEIQHEKGETSDQSIFEEEIVVAKYWARDQITNQLRTASKGNPKVQGNSIYALAGLANSVFAHENENIRKEECHQYVNMRHWLLKVADTIHVIFDGNATLPGKPFQWCQQVSSDRSTASSFISRCAAAVCLADLVRPLLPLDANRIMEMLKGLRDRCPRQIKAGTSSILHFYTCIGYGMFLSRIQHTQFAGALTSSNEDFKVEEYMDVFKNILDRNNIEGREAAVIGYTCALSSALLNKKKDDCKHVFTYYESLHRNVSRYSQDDLTTLEAQACCFSLATLTIPLYNNSSIDVERVKEIHQLLKAHADKAPQASDIYLSLGLMNNLILRSNITTHIEDVKQMLKTWEISFTESNLPVLKKLGIVKGVMATCGCLNILYEGDLQEVPETNEMKSVFKKIIRNLENSNDVLISLVSARLNGELYLSNSSKARLSSQLPPSYSYLGETSTLSSVVNVLQEKGIYDEKEIVLIFDVLSSIQCPTLPPINWTSLLTKYFQAEFSDKVKYSCIAFALKFTSTCMDLSLWLSSFIQASPFMNLSHEIQLAIFSHTSTILNALSNSKQKFLLQDLPLVALNNTSMISEILCSVLQMWLSVADMPVPIQSSYTYIYEGLMKLINNIDNYEQHFKDDICETFAKLLERVSPKHWHKMISVMREELQIYITIKFLRHSDSIVSTNLMQLLGKLGKQENEEFLRMFLEAISGFRDNKKKMAELNHFHIQLMQSILEKKIVSMAYKITSNFLGNLCHDETDGEVTWFIPPISGFRDGKMFLRLQTIFEILY